VLQRGEGQEASLAGQGASPAGQGRGRGRVLHGPWAVAGMRPRPGMRVCGSMWVDWVNPRGPLILCGLLCGFVGVCDACWPSGLAAWPVPLARLAVWEATDTLV
jgi:hypothetical protein